jgi:predicted small metal-binding protein
MKMYNLKEKDLMPGSTCEFEATGETKEETNQKMMEHAKLAHAEEFSKMTPEQTQQTMSRADELLSAQDTNK